MVKKLLCLSIAILIAFSSNAVNELTLIEKMGDQPYTVTNLTQMKYQYVFRYCILMRKKLEITSDYLAMIKKAYKFTCSRNFLTEINKLRMTKLYEKINIQNNDASCDLYESYIKIFEINSFPSEDITLNSEGSLTDIEIINNNIEIFQEEINKLKQIVCSNINEIKKFEQTMNIKFAKIDWLR